LALTLNLGSLFIFAKALFILAQCNVQYACIFKKSGGPFRGGAYGLKASVQEVERKELPHKLLCPIFATHMQLHAKSEELRSFFPWLVATRNRAFPDERVLKEAGIVGQTGYWVNVVSDLPHAKQSGAMIADGISYLWQKNSPPLRASRGKLSTIAASCEQ
jgi:hypothetical protein